AADADAINFFFSLGLSVYTSRAGGSPQEVAMTAMTKPKVEIDPATELARVLADPESKEYADLRDRVAYLHLTGSMPTHLRPYWTKLLVASAHFVKGKQPDGRFGPMQVEPEIVEKLKLEEHPMVKKVRRYQQKGYQMAGRREDTDRKPYTKIF